MKQKNLFKPYAMFLRSFVPRTASQFGFTSLLTLLILAATALPVGTFISKTFPQLTNLANIPSSQKIASGPIDSRNPVYKIGDRTVKCTSDFGSGDSQCTKNYKFCIEGACYENKNEIGYVCGNNSDCYSNKCGSSGMCQPQQPCKDFEKSYCNDKYRTGEKCFWFTGFKEDSSGKCIDNNGNFGDSCGDGNCQLSETCYSVNSDKSSEISEVPYCSRHGYKGNKTSSGEDSDSTPPVEIPEIPEPKTVPPVEVPPASSRHIVSLSGQIKTTTNGRDASYVVVTVNDGSKDVGYTTNLTFSTIMGYSLDFINTGTGVTITANVYDNKSKIVGFGQRFVTIPLPDTSSVQNFNITLLATGFEEPPAPERTAPAATAAHADGWCGPQTRDTIPAVSAKTGGTTPSCTFDGSFSVGGADAYCKTINGGKTPYYYECRTSSTGPGAGAPAAPKPVKKGSVLASDVCGSHNGLDPALSNGYLYPICTTATIPDKATVGSAGATAIEAGKYSSTEAAKKTFCGGTGYDVYRCADGTLVTDGLGSETCDNKLWCPDSKTPGPAVPAPAAPAPAAPACTTTGVTAGNLCQPSCSNQCAKNIPGVGDLRCINSKTDSSQFYCCPGGEQYCGETKKCQPSSKECKVVPTPTPTPLPAGSAALGCQDSNDVCSSNPPPGPVSTAIRGGVSSFDDTAVYMYKQNGTPACTDFYKDSPTYKDYKYCYTKTGTKTAPAAPGSPGSPATPIGAGGVAGDGAVCTSSTYCQERAPYSGTAGDRACVTAWGGTSSSAAGTFCCNYNQRFCTTNNQCVSRQSDCPDPKTAAPSKYACVSKDGRCIPGDPKLTCCTVADNPPGSVGIPADLKCNSVGGGSYQCQLPSSAAVPPVAAPPATASRVTSCATLGARAQCGNSVGPASGTSWCGGNYEYIEGDPTCNPEYCYVCNVTASAASSERIASDDSCNLNSDCVKAKLGNACVFYGGSSGVCRQM